MIEPVAKILIGTGFYIMVVWLAGRNPRATGMMLTFPTLNGIVLLMAGPDALESAASAMLLMPPLNAVLCASYLTGFDRLARAGFAPASASGLMAGAVAVVWLTIVGAITHERWGVPAEYQTTYALVAFALGLVLTLVLRPRFQSPTALATGQPLGQLVLRNQIRIMLFVSTLVLVAAVERLGGSPAILGALGGLPIVALFGMHSIASDDAIPLDERRNTLAAMASSVWLGPGMAIVFVVVLWRMLAMLAGAATGAAYLLAGIVALFAGWGFCIIAIWLSIWWLARLMPFQTRARMP